jgi:hypothetical protein
MGRIGPFAIEAILWFCFWLGVWYVSCGILMVPVYVLVKLVVAALFPSWAGSVHWTGHDFILSTNIRLGLVNGTLRTLAVKANFLTYGIGWPLMIALLLASDAQRVFVKVLLATAVLWIPQAMGVAIEFLHAAYVQSGVLPIGDVTRYLLIVAFQFAIMMLPSLAPVVLWLGMERPFVESLASAARDGRGVGTIKE